MFYLNDKVAIVTGGSGGLGGAICKFLGKQKAKVYIGYNSNSESAEKIKEEILKDRGNAEIIKLDVTDEKNIVSAFGHVYKTEGQLDIAVNCAGITIDKLLLQVKKEDIEKQLDVNLRGTILCSREAIKYMIRKRWGRIINISSVIGEMGNTGQTIYGATKAGIIGFTKSLAREVGSRNITVNVVSPGLVDTPMIKHLPAQLIEDIVKNTPIKRLVTPQEVAATVGFLATEEAAGITGSIIRINGGIYI